MFQQKKLLLYFILFVMSINAQENQKKKVSNKGKIFVYWGWNWSGYSDSDIHFKGDNYDFTLRDVSAQDIPLDFTFKKYFGIKNLTKPQTNARIGYFFKENYTISIGVDHMKYVVDKDQFAEIDGTINLENNQYNGVYTGQQIQLTEDFLRLEHTDGLNYVNIQLYRFDDISHFFGLDSEKFQINITEGVGAGILYPKTDTTLLGQERHDDYHISGFGLSAGFGLNFTFLKHFFIQADLKGGYINMPDVKISTHSSDSASQDFFFLQNNILIGGKFRL
jgi:hypothetical protein